MKINLLKAKLYFLLIISVYACKPKSAIDNKVTDSTSSTNLIIENSSSFKLTNKDLNIVLNERGDVDENESIRLSKYLNLELISKAEFDLKRSKNIDYLIKDTTAIIKKNGVIELPYGNKVNRYIDNPNDEESRQEYKYIGQIPFLNKYVLFGSYWESSDYMLIDKTTGKEEASLNSYPNISINRKYILSVSPGYESTTEFQLYGIDSTTIKLITALNFKNWMPTDVEKSFWNKDGCFYTPVFHSKVFWKEDGSLNDKNYQYLRIKIIQ